MRVNRRLGRLAKPKIIVPLIIVAAVAAVLLVVVHNMNAPAVGDIDQTASAAPEKIDPYAKPGTYNGKYISFTYPAHYKKIPSKLTGSTLEVIEYHTTDTTGKQISTAVYKGDISQDSSVVYRRQHKELYTENQTQKWVEFDKNDGTEHTFFFEHNGLEASLSATAPFDDQSGDGLFAASSLKWL